MCVDQRIIFKKLYMLNWIIGYVELDNRIINIDDLLVRFVDFCIINYSINYFKMIGYQIILVKQNIQVNIKIGLSQEYCIQQGGVVVSRWAHNSKVGGSKPLSAIFLFFIMLPLPRICTSLHASFDIQCSKNLLCIFFLQNK